MARRIALVLLVLFTMTPAMMRRLQAKPLASAGCEPEGRGVPPHHWIGCVSDPGPRRELTGQELILLKRPVDLNGASAEDLAAVPGLSPRLAEAIVADRERLGPFPSVEALERVRGIGPVRLARVRAWLTTGCGLEEVGESHHQASGRNGR